MSDYFVVLGIAPTADTKHIRRAYAKRLKTIDQDLEPQAFIELRQAFESALSDAAQHADDETQTPTENLFAAPLSVDVTVDRRAEADALAQDVAPSMPDIPQPTTQPTDATQTAYHPTEPPVDLPQMSQPDLPLFNTTPPLQPSPDLAEPEPSSEHTAAPWSIHWQQSTPPASTWRVAEPQKKIPSLGERIETMRADLWSDPWQDDAAFTRFVNLLHQIATQSLLIQMDAFDQLAYPLAYAEDCKEAERFLLAFADAVDVESLNLATADAYEHQLYQRIQKILARQKLWNDMPKQFAKHIAALRDCKRVAIWRMHQLYKSHHPWVNALRQQHWGSVIDGNPVTHANWQLLQLFSAYTWSVILMVLYAVLLFVCLGAVIDFPAEDVMVYLAIAVFGSVAWVWLWCLCVYARWRAEPLDHQRPRWFFYLLIINALVYLSVVFDVAEWIGQMAASLWAVGVLLWLGYYMMKPNSTSLLIRLHGLSRHIFAATLMVLSMFTVLWGMAMLGLIWFYQPVDQQVWRNGLSSVLLMLLPMAILFYRDVIWRDLISGWERRSDDPYTTQQKWAIGLSLAATAGLFPLLFAEHVWSVAGWLGLMVTLLTIPSKVMAYLIKYWFYLPMMGLVLSSDGGQWLAIPMMSYALFEAYRDLKLEREHQAA